MMPPVINTAHSRPHALAKAPGQGKCSILLESRSKLRRVLPPQSEVEIKEVKS